MKLIKYKLVWLVVAVGLIVGCSSSSDEVVPLDTQIKRYVWSAMNLFYYWQAEVVELSDDNSASVFSGQFLQQYQTPESLFEDLIHPDDRFSWIVDDYEELEQSFQGITKSYGFNIGLVRASSGSDDLLAYVRYIVPGGPAEAAGLKRGDIFTEVDGQQLNIDNYVSLLFESENMTIALSQIQDNVVTSINQDINLTAIQLSENPIFLSDVLEIEGQKVGYLVYNQFVNNNAFHEELNNVFGTFQSEGINDLVLDLRYNGGGSLLTARVLSSMIYGNATSSDILGSIVYNEKLAEFNTDLQFLSDVPVLNSNGNQTSSITMNRLNLNRVFILTSGSSASASEFVIAGLLPYMNVTLIGTSTVGKNAASVTLYDSDDYLKSASLNPNHRYAIQPIISQLANSQGFTDYVDGLEPNIEVNEVDFLETIKPLGDPTEALLAEALAVITGTARIERPRKSEMEYLKDIRLSSPVNTIHIDMEFSPKNIRERMVDFIQ